MTNRLTPNPELQIFKLILYFFNFYFLTRLGYALATVSYQINDRLFISTSVQGLSNSPSL